MAHPSLERGRHEALWGHGHALDPQVHLKTATLGATGRECTCACMLSHVQLFDPVDCRILCPWDYPEKNTGVGCHFLLQGIFPTQGLNLDLPHCRRTLHSKPPGEWGLILNANSPLLPSCWGFSFALGCGISSHGHPSTAQPPLHHSGLGRSPGERKGYPLQPMGWQRVGHN